MKMLKPKMDNRPNEFKEAVDKIAQERGLTWYARYNGEGLIFVDSSARDREIVFRGKLKWTGNDMTYVVGCDQVVKEGYDAALPWGDLLDGLLTHITFQLDRLIEKANAEDLANAAEAPIMPEDEVDYSKNIHDYHDLLFATKQFAQKNGIQFSLKSDAHNDTFFRFEKKYLAADENDPFAVKSKIVMSKITSDTLLIGIDISTDETVMTIARPIGNKIVQIKQLHGEVAEQVYHDLVYREEIFEEIGKAARDGVVDGLKDALDIKSPSNN